MNIIRKSCAAAVIGLVLLALGTIGTGWVRAQSEPGHAAAGLSQARSTESRDAIFYSIAATMGMSCLSAGYAVGKVGAAALGAAAEKPELLGRALIFVGLAEGIAIYGLIIGVMLILKL